MCYALFCELGQYTYKNALYLLHLFIKLQEKNSRLFLLLVFFFFFTCERVVR